MLSLYDLPISSYCCKIRIILRHKGLEWKSIPPPGGYGSDAYCKLVPSGTIPALDHDGFIVGESDAISEYLNAHALQHTRYCVLRVHTRSQSPIAHVPPNHRRKWWHRIDPSGPTQLSVPTAFWVSMLQLPWKRVSLGFDRTWEQNVEMWCMIARPETDRTCPTRHIWTEGDHQCPTNSHSLVMHDEDT